MSQPTVETAAEAAYLATMTFRQGYLPFQPWEKLPDHWKRIYRAQAAAIITLIAPEPSLFDMESP